MKKLLLSVYLLSTGASLVGSSYEETEKTMMQAVMDYTSSSMKKGFSTARCVAKKGVAKTVAVGSEAGKRAWRLAKYITGMSSRSALMFSSGMAARIVNTALLQEAQPLQGLGLPLEKGVSMEMWVVQKAFLMVLAGFISKMAYDMGATAADILEDETEVVPTIEKCAKTMAPFFIGLAVETPYDNCLIPHQELAIQA